MEKIYLATCGLIHIFVNEKNVFQLTSSNAHLQCTLTLFMGFHLPNCNAIGPQINIQREIYCREVYYASSVNSWWPNTICNLSQLCWDCIGAFRKISHSFQQPIAYHCLLVASRCDRGHRVWKIGGSFKHMQLISNMPEINHHKASVQLSINLPLICDHFIIILSASKGIFYGLQKSICSHWSFAGW